VVIIEFPDTEKARAWYDSPAYQEILLLRTDNIEGEAILVDGVAPGYDPRATAAALRQTAAGPPADRRRRRGPRLGNRG